MSLFRTLIPTVLALLVALPAPAERPAMGGREAWAETRYVAWNFYGKRFHVWDTWTDDLRTDAMMGYTVLMNLRTGEGRVWREGEELEGEELANALDIARRTWINDSYWST